MWMNDLARRVVPTALALAVSALAAPGARAADEEIQVYMDEIGPVGAVGLDLHLNYVPAGRTLPDYPGGQVSEGRFRLTPEWSYAVSPNVELGAYLPLTTIDRNGKAEIGGVKGRIKFVASRPEGRDWFWGLNLEVGRVRRDLDINPWNAELKGILGVRKGPWTLASNFNFGWVVSGPQRGSPDMQLALKGSYSLDEDTAIGLESFTGLGTTKAFGRLSRNDQQIFAVIDKTLGRWDFDLGLGHGYGAPEDNWIVKLIVGVPIGG